MAFSCCVYDGGDAEKNEMDSIREKGWGEKFIRKAHIIAPDLNRINGKCPMTPLEVSLSHLKIVSVFCFMVLGDR